MAIRFIVDGPYIGQELTVCSPGDDTFVRYRSADYSYRPSLKERRPVGWCLASSLCLVSRVKLGQRHILPIYMYFKEV